MLRWQFRQATKGDTARESQAEKFFSSDVVADRGNAIVREGIQNALDATEDGQVTLVRIKIGTIDLQSNNRVGSYFDGFIEHIGADAVRSKIPDIPGPGELFTYLCFEDFGTRGLEGDPAAWWPEDHGAPNPFFNFFRAEGISGKEPGKRGRHGVGRLVFKFASRVRAIFALTRRFDSASDSSTDLLMGTAVLPNHRVADVPYTSDGYYGLQDTDNPNWIMPVQSISPEIERFRADFALTRKDEKGLSIVVPWLNLEIDIQSIRQAVVKGYFFPILKNQLTVETFDPNGGMTQISAETIEALCNFEDVTLRLVQLAHRAVREANFVRLPAPPSGEAPKWNKCAISEDMAAQIRGTLDAQEMCSVRVPMTVTRKGDGSRDCHFDIFLERASDVEEREVYFVREGILVSDMHPRRTPGIRALVVIEAGPLGEFLGDAENPSHTQWQKEAVKSGYKFAPANIEYVVQSVPNLVAKISQRQREPDASLLLDLFAVPGHEDNTRRKSARKPTRKPGDQSPDVPEISTKPARFRVHKRDGGFTVKRGAPEAARPSRLKIKVAYDVRKGNPLAKYRTDDFSLDRPPIVGVSRNCVITSSSENMMTVEVCGDDFEVCVTGFDTRIRDLYVDVRAEDSRGESEPESTDILEKSDAEAL